MGVLRDMKFTLGELRTVYIACEGFAPQDKEIEHILAFPINGEKRIRFMNVDERALGEPAAVGYDKSVDPPSCYTVLWKPVPLEWIERFYARGKDGAAWYADHCAGKQWQHVRLQAVGHEEHTHTAFEDLGAICEFMEFIHAPRWNEERIRKEKEYAQEEMRCYLTLRRPAGS